MAQVPGMAVPETGESVGSASAASGTPPGHAAEVPAYPSSARAWYMIWLIAFVTMLANIDRSVINLLIEPMKHDMHLSDTQVSLLTGMAFSFFYLCTGYPMSRVSDVRSRKWVLAGGLLVWSLGTALCGFARGFWGLFAARGVVGASEAVPGPASLSMISDLVPPRLLPRAYAVYTLGIGVGQSLAMVIGGVLLGLFLELGDNGSVSVPLLGSFRAWQLVFLACGAPGLLTFLLWIGTTREPARRGRLSAEPVPFAEFLRYLRLHRRIFVPMFLSIAIGSIQAYGALTWRVPMFQRTYSWSASFSGELFGLVAILTLPVSLIGGTWLAEHLLKRRDPGAMVRISATVNLCAMPFSILAPLMPDGWLSFALLFMGALVMGVSSPAINAAIQFVTPNELRGQLSSLYLITISVVGTWFGPLFVALVSDYVLRDEALLRYAMSGFALLLCPIATVLMWRAIGPFGEEVRRRGIV